MSNEYMEDEIDYDLQEKNIKKFLTFLSDGLLFGVNAANVTEIITNHSITLLPMVPEYIRGILNLRGQIIPIIDIRLRMNKPRIDFTDESCIIVVDINSISIGILVDSVSQVIDISEEKILPSPSNNTEGLVNGILSLSDSTILSLDCEKLIH